MSTGQGIIRKPSLDEWFLSLQLKKIKDGCHLPLSLTVDVSHLVEKYKNENKKLSFTALIIKASSLLIKENPLYNRAYFNTIFGQKIIEPMYNAVNVPVEIHLNNKKIVTSTTIKNAFEKSLEEISQELKKEKNKKLTDLPVNNLIHGPGLYFFNKLKLRLLFFIFSNFPHFYLKKEGGGISFSSLFAVNRSNHNILVTAFGMTTLTFCSASIFEREGKTLLTINVGFDHTVTHGADGIRALSSLAEIFSRNDL